MLLIGAFWPVLLDVAQKVGLDAKRAAEILESDEFAAEVRGREKFYADRGIRALRQLAGR